MTRRKPQHDDTTMALRPSDSSRLRRRLHEAKYIFHFFLTPHSCTTALSCSALSLPSRFPSTHLPHPLLAYATLRKVKQRHM